MKEKIKKVIEEYQCPGCMGSSGSSCYQQGNEKEIQCTRHIPETRVMPPYIGLIFLGLPVGFNRLGITERTKISIFERFEDGWGYQKFNVPIWKHLDQNGNTLVRGMCPRLNMPWIHIFLNNHLSEIDCLEITQQDIDEME